MTNATTYVPETITLLGAEIHSVHVRKACRQWIRECEKSDVPRRGRPTKVFVMFEDKTGTKHKVPAKVALGIAWQIATANTLDAEETRILMERFSGGEFTAALLQRLGFKIRRRVA